MIEYREICALIHTRTSCWPAPIIKSASQSPKRALHRDGGTPLYKVLVGDGAAPFTADARFLVFSYLYDFTLIEIRFGNAGNLVTLVSGEVYVNHSGQL
jgi:hypothetical protein